MNSGKWLLIREVFSLLLKTLGTFWLIKIIGPVSFGIYSTAIGFMYLICSIAQFGINVNVVKSEEKDISSLWSLSFVISGACFIIAILMLPLLHLYTKSREITVFTSMIIMNIFFYGIKMVPLGILEKTLKFKKISGIEFISQVVFYLIAIPGSYLFGIYALAVASDIFFILNLILVVLAVGYLPPFYFNKSLLIKQLKFGIGYTNACIAFQLKDLTGLLLTPIIGVENVGYISFANKIIDNINVFRDTTRRLSLSIFSKLINDKNKITLWLIQGMLVQILIVGITLLGLQLTLPIFISIMGQKWNQSSHIISYLTFSTLFMSMTTIPTAILYNMGITKYSSFSFYTQNFLLLISSTILCNFLGVQGYCYAVLLQIPSTLIIFRGIYIHIGRINYMPTLLWTGSFSLALLACTLDKPYLLWVAFIPVLLHKERILLTGLFNNLRRAL
jgi:O-antigen/teichoic acid export membrane protein